MCNGRPASYAATMSWSPAICTVGDSSVSSDDVIRALREQAKRQNLRSPLGYAHRLAELGIAVASART